MTRMLLFFHLIGGAVWLGGNVTVGALVPALRSAGVERPQLQAMARRFGTVSWIAMALSVSSGVSLVLQTDRDWGDLGAKLGVVALTVVLAGLHQLTAARSTAAQRGVLQGAILLATLGVFAVATGL